jgi:hypothetical protein
MRNAPVLLFASLAANARQVYMPVRRPQTGDWDEEKESIPCRLPQNRAAVPQVSCRSVQLANLNAATQITRDIAPGSMSKMSTTAKSPT